MTEKTSIRERNIFRKGETQRKNGTYAYRWQDAEGKRHTVYAPDLDRLRAIEEAADRVTVVSDGADEAADYILRDCYMVDASERMIIVYDDDSKGPSGTKDALLYARSSGVEIRQIQWMHL